jgi:predicted permease
MVLTGISLSAFAPRELVTDVKTYIVVALRLVGIPALVFGACTLLRLDGVIVPATIMASMPCGLNTIVFPKLVGEDCKTGARLALISHLFSLVTLPLWLSILM